MCSALLQVKPILRPKKGSSTKGPVYKPCTSIQQSKQRLESLLCNYITSLDMSWSHMRVEYGSSENDHDDAVIT